MADKKFTDKSVMWTLLNKLTVGGMFHDLSAKSGYHAVQELLLADEEYDEAWELYEEGETGPGIIAAFDRATAATERRAAAIRAMRGEPPVG